jgi:signal peptidase I
MSTVTDVDTSSSAAIAHEPSRRRNTPQSDAGTSLDGATGSGAMVLKALRRMASILSTVVVVVAVAAFLFLAVGPRVFGYQTSTMLTGSMSPLINPGDVVVTVPTPVGDIRVGDIITYHIPVEDQRVETHRITEILTNQDGTRAVRTKGDANEDADPWLATLQGTTVDKHVLTVPYLGQAIRALRQPLILNSLMYGAPAVLVAGLLASIWRKEPDRAADGK